MVSDVQCHLSLMISYVYNVCIYIGPPSITYISNQTVSAEGNKVSLVCVAINDIDAIHSLQINWYKGNKPVLSNGKHILLYNKADNISRQLNSTLLFDPVNRTDDGEYTCQAFNHNDSFSEAKTNLSVQCTV